MRSIAVAFASLVLATTYGQEKVHKLYNSANYAVHHDRVFHDTYMGRTLTYPRTWSVQKTQDGVYVFRDYTQNSGGNNGTYHEVLAKKYLSSEIMVSRNKISVYWEERRTRPSDFYTTADTTDPMKLGGMKPPKDPFSGHKKGTETYKSEFSIGGKSFKINVVHKCTHQRVSLYRGTDMGMGYGIGVTTDSRGKTTATRDYYPDHLFKHQVRMTYSLDEMAKSVGMTKEDLIIFLIEHSDELRDLNIVGNMESYGFIYCAYRAFVLDRLKGKHERQIAARQAEEKEKKLLQLAEQARLDSIRQIKEQEERIRKDQQFFESLGSEKRASLKNAETKGVNLVDLGLSVRWADRNLGAANIDDAGEYYAWGEITPKSDGNSKYKPVMKPKAGATLDANSDPATAKWGKGWHVPSTEQWDELFQKCSMREKIDHTGVVFTGPNGNSITLPFTNYEYWAHYWTNYCGSKGYARKASIPRQAPTRKVSGVTVQSSNSPETGSMSADHLFPVRAVME